MIYKLHVFVHDTKTIRHPLENVNKPDLKPFLAHKLTIKYIEELDQP